VGAAGHLVWGVQAAGGDERVRVSRRERERLLEEAAALSRRAMGGVRLVWGVGRGASGWYGGGGRGASGWYGGSTVGSGISHGFGL